MAPHLHLKILIVGAGIAGLTLACALLTSTAGGNDLEIVILESSDKLQETGAGIQLSPNATRVLRSFSLDNVFEEVISRLDSIKVRSFTEGKEVDSIPLNSGGLAELTYGSEYVEL
jgi:salicylate hydroxylase